MGIFVLLVFVSIFITVSSLLFFFFFKQNTAYYMRISYWSSDVCSSDLNPKFPLRIPTRYALNGRAVGPVVAMTAFSQFEQCPAQRLKRISFTPQFVGTGDRERFYFGAGALAVAPKSKEDRKSGVSGRSVSVRVDLGGRRSIKKNK